MSRREQLAAHAAWQSLWPFLLLVPVMGGLIWWLVGQGLEPIARLARAIAQRSPAAMEPVSEAVPTEVQPLVRALNELLSRLQAALQAQRQFVADAAHELRTPLAALQLQAQLVERAANEPARSAALTELNLGLKRSARAVQQLLTLAREEPGTLPAAFENVRINALIDFVVAQHRGQAAAKGIDLYISRAPGDYEVKADEASLRTLLANLLDNALRYTPAGGAVTVAVQPRDAGLSVSIDDTGPGIPAQDRQRVFDRFHRREGVDESGTGLGLSIVKAIADRHGLAVSLEPSAASGLSVRIEFPASVLAASKATPAA